MAGEAKLVRLCAAADVAEGEARPAEAEGVTYAVYNLAGAYYVTADACTHGPGLLSEGAVIGEEIECPFHQGRFHIATGQPSLPPCTEPVRVWKVHLVDGQICIDPREHPG
jgi:nitrite reductase/ring-hydroxylating ferredoxin subunit